MADRKQTPDVLGDILGGVDAPLPSTPEPAPSDQPEPIPQAQPQQRKRTSRRVSKPPKKEKWEYLLVSFQEYRGWRPRFLNGRELSDWMDAPLIHEYVDQLGEEGWELASASAGQSLYGLTDRRQLYFKRPKR